MATVSFADVLNDQQWFADHPHRQYRLRPGWVVRRCIGNTYLRTPLADNRHHPDDNERRAEQIWWTAAWPDLSPLARAKLAKEARQRTKTRSR